MIKNLLSKKNIIVITLIFVLFALVTILNYQYSMANPGGNDFLSKWVGTKGLLEEGLSPYSKETASKIQISTNGLSAVDAENGASRVDFPLYSILLFFPFALINKFLLARAIWMTVLELALGGIIIYSIRLTYWKIKPWMLITFLLFGIFFFHGIEPLVNGNVVILVTLMVLFALISIRNDQDEIAGALLAFTTIKPNVVVLLLAYILIWAIFKRRTKIIIWFSGVMALLIGFSVLIIPDWIIQNLRQIVQYPIKAPGSLGALMVNNWGAIGSRFSIALSIFLAFLLLFEWWQSRMGGFKQFLWTAMITIVISQWIGIQTDPDNFVLLYPALFVGLELIWERWKNRADGVIFLTLAALFIGVWVLFLTTLNLENLSSQSSIMFFPFPLFLIFLLYWSKWWVQKSSKIHFDSNKIDLNKL